MEFGVASGGTLRKLRKLLPLSATLYGFDSFEGLPEPWFGYKKGTFATPYRVELPNTVLVEGWFEVTVSTFAKSHPFPVSLMHIDCDLYSSTLTVLNAFRNQIMPGTIVIFDELFGYEGFEDHEYRALTEFARPFTTLARWEAFRAAVRFE